MAKGKSTWKYNKLLTARRNYFFNGGDAYTPTNPFQTDAQSIIGSPGTDPKIEIPTTSLEGDTSGASNASKFGPWAAAAAMIGADVAQTINMARGEDVKAQSKDLQSSIAGQQMQGVGASNDSFDSLSSDWQNFNTINNISKKDLGYTDFGKGLTQNLLSGKVLSSTIGNALRNKVVKKETAKVNNLIADTNAFNERSLINRADNLVAQQGNTLESNYAAYGGELNTQGGDFTNGLLYINNGGSHESNPYEGVPMGRDSQGTPNLVEEGETIFNDYVFSKRLKVPKSIIKKYKLGGNLSFADVSKKLAKESEERPNDPISKAGLKAFMEDLSNAQEELKQKQQEKEMMKQMAAMEAAGIDPMMMQENPEEMGMEAPMIAAYGGKVNKFDTGSQMDRRVMAPIQETSYSYGSGSQNNAAIYGDWSNFRFGDIPLYNNGVYAPIYTSSDFQDWLRGEEGIKFTNTWWGNKDNAPDYYSDKDSNGNKKSKINTSAPTIDQLLGTSNNGLMYDTNFGDAHRFGMAALNEYMRTHAKDVKDRRWLQSVKDGKVTGSSLIEDYYKDLDKNGVSWLDNHEGRKEMSRALRYDEKEKQWYNDIYYRDPEKKDPKSHYVSLLGADGKETQRLLFDDAMKQGLLKGRRQLGDPSTDTDGNDVSYYELDPEIDKGKYANWLRYAPAVSYGIGAVNSFFAKPDFSNADAILEAYRGAGTYKPVQFNPVGNYLTYKPFDRDYYLNKLNAEAGASRRLLANTSGGNRGTAMAGILSADNNALNQIGALARQGEEYNLAQRQQVEGFNRDTNNINSQGFLQADMANQKALIDARESSLKGTLAAAEMRQRAQDTFDASRSQNINGFFQTLADIGTDEYTSRQRDMYIDKSGIAGYTDWSRAKEKQPVTTAVKAKGGKLKKKKKGFTI